MAHASKYQELAKLMKTQKEEIHLTLNKCREIFESFACITICRCFILAPPWATKRYWNCIFFKPEPITINYEKEFLKMLFNCPDKSEISEEIDLFERKEEENSLTYQLKCINEEVHQSIIIESNLTKNAFPLYVQAIKNWNNDPDSKDVHAENQRNLYKLPFTPNENETIAEAYKKQHYSRQKKEAKHRYSLRCNFKKLLEEGIFENIPSSSPKRKTFLQEFLQTNMRKINNIPQKCSIDYLTAAKCIQFLIDGFLANPEKTALGEAACILWVCIQAVNENFKISITQIINLTTVQISEKNNFIDFSTTKSFNQFEDSTDLNEQNTLRVTKGLIKLLLCLRGRGTGKHKCLLFHAIRNEKKLNRLLHKISEELGFSYAILLEHFTFPFHIHQGIQLPTNRKRHEIKSNPIVPLRSLKQRTELKKFLKNIGQITTAPLKKY